MTISEIELNFINRSKDTSNEQVVIFQRNLSDIGDNKVVAWHVIPSFDYGREHPFTIPMELQVDASDAEGHHTARFSAMPGQAFDMVKEAEGYVLKRSTHAAGNPGEVEIRNKLERGPINANVYRGNRLLGTKSDLPPGQKAVFQFTKSIHIGCSSEAAEGDLLDLKRLAENTCEINMLEISSADIVMTGGGPSQPPQPIAFHIENEVKN